MQTRLSAKLKANKRGPAVDYTHYDFLDLPPGASAARIEAAYQTIKQRFDSPSDDQLVRMIHEAYAVLSNPDRRQAYDGELERIAAAADAELKTTLDAQGTRHEMMGLLGLETSFATRRMHLGYRLAELTVGMPGHAAGARLRGHEFHYATILTQPDLPLAAVRDANGADVAESGSRRGQVTGTFFHLIADDR